MHARKQIDERMHARKQIDERMARKIAWLERMVVQNTERVHALTRSPGATNGTWSIHPSTRCGLSEEDKHQRQIFCQAYNLGSV